MVLLVFKHLQIFIQNKEFVMKNKVIKLSELGNSKIQDILDELGMLENGKCQYTAEEIFKAGIEYNIELTINWLKENMDLEHDFPSNNEELINAYIKNFKE